MGLEMNETGSGPSPQATLNTRLEDDFVAPLAAMRGCLEVLRDCPDLTPEEHRRFVEVALRECARLGRGVASLAETVYAEPQPAPTRTKSGRLPDDAYLAYRDRMTFLKELEVLEVDFSDFLFEDSAMVNAFYDVIDEAVEATGRKWHFVVNFRDCRVWPEAWVAFAHRGKKANVNYALSTSRYAASPETAAAMDPDPDLFPSRDAALAHVASLRRNS